jgi:hypothetical protein
MDKLVIWVSGVVKVWLSAQRGSFNSKADNIQSSVEKQPTKKVDAITTTIPRSP